MRERERERERQREPFCERKLCKEWKRVTNLQYEGREKKKQNKGIKKEKGRVISRQNVWGDEKVKRMRKVGESVNAKKKRVQFDEYNFLLF